MAETLKSNLHISDAAYNRLIQMAYELGYVRGTAKDDRPRGLSHFANTLPDNTWIDTRPPYLLGTGQWHTGMAPLTERCLHLSRHAIANLARVAMLHSIWPYKSQAPVVNGFRKEATIPKLYPVGETPPGCTSVRALVAPVLEAIGLGYLTPTSPLTPAPPDLYQEPSRRYRARERRRMLALSDSL